MTLSQGAGVVALAVVTLAVSGCSDDGTFTTLPRPFAGGVTLVTGGGITKDSLPMAPGYPKLELSSRFLLEVSGTFDGRLHHATLSIDPLKPLPARYDLPRDAMPLSLDYTRDGAAVPLGKPTGFIDIKRRDTQDGAGGAATISVVLPDGGGFPLLELDLVFK